MNPQLIIQNKVKAYYRKKLYFQSAAGLFHWFTVLAIIWLSTFAADSVFFFSTPARWVILFFNLSLSVMFLHIFFGKPIFSLLKSSQKNFTDITNEIGEEFPDIHDTLTNNFQLMSHVDQRFSKKLRDYAVDRFAARIRELDFTRKLNIKKHLFPLPFLAFIWIGSLVIIMMMPGMLFVSLQRVFNPLGEYAMVPEFHFEVNPGNSIILAGQPFSVQVKYYGPVENKILLKYKVAEAKEFQQTVLNSDGQNYTATLENLKKNTIYYLQALPAVSAEWQDKITSEKYTVEVRIPPFLSDLKLSVQPPAYTRLEETYPEKNVGDIIVYPGSVVNISARASKKISEASVFFSDSSENKLTIRDNALTGKFTVFKSTNYHFQLTDEEGIQNQNPISYTITALADLYPTVDIIEPGSDVELAADAALNLLIEGADDFGFTKLNLFYQVIASLEEARDTSWYTILIPLNAGGEKIFQKPFLFNFAQMFIGFDDAIKYYAGLQDNDIISGPKTGRSKIYFVRFPSINQIFEEFTHKQDDTIDEVEQQSKSAEELQKNLEQISRELKREKNIDWERKREIEATLEKQKEIHEEIQRVEKELDEAIRNLEQNDLFSPEILEKYRQVQELFSEIITPELLQAMEELQKALQNLNPDQIQKAMENFKIDQKRFQENLDRTLELFKKVKMEQELDRLVQMAQKMVEEQNKITEKLQHEKSLENNDQKQLEGKEQNQNENLKQMERSIHPLIKNDYVQQFQETLKNLQEAQTMAADQELSQQMNQLQQMTMSGQQKQAGKKSEQIGKDLEHLSNKLQQAQKNMLQQDMEKMMQKMQTASENLLRLSKDEEKLMRESQKISNLSDRFNELADRQQQVLENTNRVINELIDLSHQTFYVGTEMSKAMGRAIGTMRKSLEELEGRNQQGAGKNQENSMAALNEAVMNMQNSMQKMQQAGSTSGFEQFMEQMKQMAGQQGQLNNESLNFFKGQGNRGSMSAEEQAQLARMAAEQRALQRSLEEMSQKEGERSDVLGRLDNIAEEMEKVVKELEAAKIDRKTIERQQQILSRMLDATKSVREREYSKQRKSEIGKHYAKKSPIDVINPVNAKMEKLSKDLLRALQEGYNPDYEKLIEEYFRRLNQEALKN